MQLSSKKCLRKANPGFQPDHCVVEVADVSAVILSFKKCLRKLNSGSQPDHRVVEVVDVSAVII